MASISQGLVLTTAIVVTSTVLYLAFSGQKIFPSLRTSGNSNSQDSNKPILRSYLYSDDRKRQRKKSRKRVQFSDNVKEASETNNKLRREQRKQNRESSRSRNEISKNLGMPANRIALYNGILKDSLHRMEFSY